MGKSLTPIMFFSDEITIVPHTATGAEYLGKKVSISEFAAGRPCSLDRCEENGEYVVYVRTPMGREFMEGPEA